MTYPMKFTWRCCFFLAIAVGLVAVVYCALVLGGIDLAPDGKKASTPEAAVGLVVGLLLQPFAWTGLRHARMSLTERELHYLGFGFVCKRRTILLEEIERFGTGTVKSSGGGRDHMLVVELRDGYFRDIKLTMYDGWKRFLDELEQRLGQAPQETKRTLAGIRFPE